MLSPAAPTSKRVAFITGASSGIGAALARRFAVRGYNLVLLARRLDRLESVARECKTLRNDTETFLLATDVTQASALATAARSARERFGRIDVVIANAGFGVSGRLDELTVDDYRRQFETNVFGVLNTIYATLDDLKRVQGHLAILGSVAGYFSVPGNSAYCMSKFAVRTLADSLWVELHSKGVSVTLVSPGYVESEIHNVDNTGVFRPEKKVVIPQWLYMDANLAAEKVARAIERRRREIILTGHGKALIFIIRHFRGSMLWLLRKFSGVTRSMYGKNH
jgi:short-subunit dehydrogenase